MYKKYCELREARGVNDSTVANATGINKTTFADWTSGRSEPKLKKLAAIAKYFGVTVDYFVD